MPKESIQNSFMVVLPQSKIRNRNPKSLDYSVRSHQHVGRNRQTDLLGRFQIDDELEFVWLLHGEIGWLPAFEDFVHIGRGAPEQVGDGSP